MTPDEQVFWDIEFHALSKAILDNPAEFVKYPEENAKACGRWADVALERRRESRRSQEERMQAMVRRYPAMFVDNTQKS